jgi:RimJ/RimL family protein N-acetyltransferase
MDTLIADGFMLRSFQPSDFNRLAAMFADPVVMEHVFHGGPLTGVALEQFMEQYLTSPRNDGWGAGPIVELRSGDVVGCAGMTPFEEFGAGELEFGLAIIRELWGRKIGKRVCAELIRYGLEDRGLRRVLATCHPENQRSCRLLQSLGMRWIESREFADRGIRDVYCTP